MNLIRATMCCLLTTVGMANATTLVTPAADPITITFDEPALKVQLFETTSGYPGFYLSFQPVSVTTGEYEFTFEMSSSVPFNARLGGLFLASVAPAPADVQIRFSRPSLSYLTRLVDLDTGSVLTPKPAGDYELLAPVKRVELTFKLNFDGGHYLTPSDDPTCASFSCMKMGEDRAVITSLSFGTAVPEPSQWVLMAAGLALVGCAARRRPS